MKSSIEANNRSKIVYLIKFVAEKEYAEDLLNGKLYMNQAAYYHSVQENDKNFSDNKGYNCGQADQFEAAMADGRCIYSGMDRPIYCLYAVYENQIENDVINIDKRIIKDFKPKYAVIINFQAFNDKLNSEELDTIFSVGFGEVSYRYKTLEDTKLMMSGEQSPLFIKSPCYSYQQEYRIVVLENLEKFNTYETINYDGFEMLLLKKHAYKEYFMKSDIRNIAKIIKMSECEVLEDKLLIPVI